jgi:hypothetical protein
METLEDVAQHYAENWEEITGLDWENTYPTEASKIDFISGAKWQEKRMYSEEEVKRFIFDALRNFDLRNGRIELEQWFNEFKKKQ